MNDSHEFWNFIEQLVARSEIVIDREKGSAHPKYPDIIYPLDYGYLAGTIAADGGGIDVWVGSKRDGQQISGIVITVDLLKRDVEIKILLYCSDDEIEQVIPLFHRNGIGCYVVRYPTG